MANNFANVEHFADRNVDGLAYMKDTLANVMGANTKADKAEEFGSFSMAAIKALGRKAFGAIPLFRTKPQNNGVMTFQAFFNDFAETNNMSQRLRMTGVWDDATKAAFDMMVAKYSA
ncbi:hypothetical protein YUBABA_01050 [Serratia phage vB_SmaM-Yubaba]|nr:hypothetical protein SUREIYA_01310 [Serratia phage vB_SmaM-Sureiya]UQT03311.1 hypothetical protein YUBABA_01050 [Serratia phage vB_SmaM-Yubaba]